MLFEVSMRLIPATCSLVPLRVVKTVDGMTGMLGVNALGPVRVD